MRPIVKIKFGSVLYGTFTSDSDVDIRAVHIPSASDILLQRVTPVASTRANVSAPTKAGELDQINYALHAFVDTCLQGDLSAMDLLFAPEGAVDDSYTEDGARLWSQLTLNRLQLISHKDARWLRYCRSRLGAPRKPKTWSELYHEVRIASQALEMMRTGRITFPRPNASRLIQIKAGLLPMQEVASEATMLLHDAVTLADDCLPTQLPSTKEWSDYFVKRAYRDEVLRDV